MIKKRKRKPQTIKYINRQELPCPIVRDGHFTYIFFDLVYFERVYVIWNVNEDQRIAFINKEFKRNVKPYKNDDRWSMRTSVIDGNQLLAIRRWKFDDRGLSSLAHECLHIAHNILSVRAVEFDNSPKSHNEAYCYFLQGLFYRILVGIGAATDVDPKRYEKTKQNRKQVHSWYVPTVRSRRRTGNRKARR